VHFIVIYTAIVVVVFSAFRSAAAPTALDDDGAPEWTYLEIYNHAFNQSGREDFTAAFIKNHIATSVRDWNDTYQGDIHLDPDGNGILTTPVGRSASFVKRQQASGYMTGYPYSYGCSGFSWTWDNPYAGCYTYWANGDQLQMKAILTNGIPAAYWGIWIYYGNYCGEGVWWSFNPAYSQCWSGRYNGPFWSFYLGIQS
jgi:hypothetical protein